MALDINVMGNRRITDRRSQLLAWIDLQPQELVPQYLNEMPNHCCPQSTMTQTLDHRAAKFWFAPPAWGSPDTRAVLPPELKYSFRCSVAYTGTVENLGPGPH